MDEETKKIISQTEAIKKTMASLGWEYIEERLKKLSDGVCDIRNIDKSLEVEKQLEQMRVAELAVEMINSWLGGLTTDIDNAKMVADTYKKDKNKMIIRD